MFHCKDNQERCTEIAFSLAIALTVSNVILLALVVLLFVWFRRIKRAVQAEMPLIALGNGGDRRSKQLNQYVDNTKQHSALTRQDSIESVVMVPSPLPKRRSGGHQDGENLQKDTLHLAVPGNPENNNTSKTPALDLGSRQQTWSSVAPRSHAEAATEVQDHSGRSRSCMEMTHEEFESFDQSGHTSRLFTMPIEMFDIELEQEKRGSARQSRISKSHENREESWSARDKPGYSNPAFRMGERAGSWERASVNENPDVPAVVYNGPCANTDYVDGVNIYDLPPQEENAAEEADDIFIDEATYVNWSQLSERETVEQMEGEEFANRAL